MINLLKCIENNAKIMKDMGNLKEAINLYQKI